MAVDLKPKDVAPLRSDTHVAVCSQKALFTQGGLEKNKKRERERASIASEGWEGHTHSGAQIRNLFWEGLTVTDERENKVNPTGHAFFLN